MKFAEVIGDPVAHSLSPAIHNHWLSQLHIEAEYRATRVQRDELGAFLEQRRATPNWRGCNVTIPHKQQVVDLLDEVADDARAIGAVNTVVREGQRLVGYNSDVNGIAAALGAKPLGSRHVAIIGAGGAARAMVAYLAARGPAAVTVIARDSTKAESLHSLRDALELTIAGIDDAATALEGAALIVNASPLGMSGAAPMPEALLEAVESHARGTILFDMVYKPLDTEFLRRGSAAGGEPVDGLTMLVGQARSAFERFFRAEPPPRDGELRSMLKQRAGASSS